MPEIVKGDENKVSNFLRCCEAFEKKICSIENFWKERMQNKIDRFTLEYIHTRYYFFGDFRDELEKVFRECFENPLKEDKKRSQTKKILEKNC